MGETSQISFESLTSTDKKCEFCNKQATQVIESEQMENILYICERCCEYFYEFAKRISEGQDAESHFDEMITALGVGMMKERIKESKVPIEIWRDVLVNAYNQLKAEKKRE